VSQSYPAQHNLCRQYVYYLVANLFWINCHMIRNCESDSRGLLFYARTRYGWCRLHLHPICNWMQFKIIGFISYVIHTTSSFHTSPTQDHQLNLLHASRWALTLTMTKKHFYDFCNFYGQI
jgi:hypothetical protein